MSRKNLLTSFTERKLTAVNIGTQSPEKSDIPSTAVERNRSRGAFGAITKSIDALSQQAQSAKEIEAKLLEGNTIIELDTALIDGSFVRDRFAYEKEEFEELVAAIKEQGQLSPVLVRPHPKAPGRFMTVFGHRRLRAAKELGIAVKAVVKDVDDITHIVAQGQENSARADLTFIEKAVFAQSLTAAGHGRELVMAALSVDKASVSKMMSVVDIITLPVIELIGAAKSAGRDTWYQLSLKVKDNNLSKSIISIFNELQLDELDSDQRLEAIIKHVDILTKSKVNVVQRSNHSTSAKTWRSNDNSVTLTLNRKSKKLGFEFPDQHSSKFGDWVANNLDRLYGEFKQTKTD